MTGYCYPMMNIDKKWDEDFCFSGNGRTVILSLRGSHIGGKVSFCMLPAFIGQIVAEIGFLVGDSWDGLDQ